MKKDVLIVELYIIIKYMYLLVIQTNIKEVEKLKNMMKYLINGK